MKLRASFRPVAALIVFAFLANVLGCNQSRMLQVNELSPGTNGTLNLYLKNGSAIEFPNEQYVIDTLKSQHTIRGQGTITKDSSNSVKHNFSGTVLLSQIDSVRISKDSPVSEAVGLGIVVTGLLIITALIAGWIFGPISFG